MFAQESPEKIVSLDGSYYYITNGEYRPTGWLLVDGATPAHGLDWLPFNFWKVPTERPAKYVPASDDEATRYAERNQRAGGVFLVKREPPKPKTVERDRVVEIINWAEQEVSKLPDLDHPRRIALVDILGKLNAL